MREILARLPEKDRPPEFPAKIRADIIAAIQERRMNADDINQQLKAELKAWLLRSEELIEPYAGSVLVTVMQKKHYCEPVALLVLDIVDSTKHVLDVGDTVFSSVIGVINQKFKRHAAASDMLFLKCTGDGFLAVYNSASSALAVASAFLETPVHKDLHVNIADLHVRIAINWGAVKRRPDGDVLGREVHRVCRVEGVKNEDRTNADKDALDLPLYNRIIVTRQFLEQLDEAGRMKFTPAGSFRLKGFEERSDLWIMHSGKGSM